jgi:MFS superfamily sulfate permease-like transporter
MASLSLSDVKSLRRLWMLDKRELAVSVIATLGVVWVGAINAILFAVILALMRFVQLVARPRVEILGKVKGHAGFHSIERHASATTVPGLVLFRFNSPLVFFNAPFFKRRAIAAIEAAGTELNWFVIDLLPLTQVDVTGTYVLEELKDELGRRGATLVFAGRRTEAALWLRERGLDDVVSMAHYFPTLRQAVRAYGVEHGAPRPKKGDGASGRDVAGDAVPPSA